MELLPEPVPPIIPMVSPFLAEKVISESESVSDEPYRGTHP